MKINKKSIGGQIKKMQKKGTEKNGEKKFYVGFEGMKKKVEGFRCLTPQRSMRCSLSYTST